MNLAKYALAACLALFASSAFADMADLSATAESCATAEGDYFIAHGVYFEGDCLDMPGFVSSGGTDCHSTIVGGSFVCDVKQVGVGRCSRDNSSLSLTCSE